MRSPHTPRSLPTGSTLATLTSWVSLLLSPLTLSALAQSEVARAPFTPQDLVSLNRVSDPQVSPDGRLAIYTLRETDLAADRGRTDLWLIDLQQGLKSAPRQLTQHPASDSHPRWAPDGSGIYFLSSRSGSSQIWYLPLGGGEAQPVTELKVDVGSFDVAPTGDRLALSLEVFPDCDTLACSADRQTSRKKSKASGQVYDQLFVRHWDTWKDGTRAMLYTVPLDKDATSGPGGRAGEPVLVSGKIAGDLPHKPFGGEEDYVFSPDGKRLVVSVRLATPQEPWSTNFDLYEINADGTGEPRNLTADNLAWDAGAVFLSNGDLVWRAMRRPGFEADRFELKLRSARDGSVRSLTADWDRSVGGLSSTFDGERLLVTTDDIGQVSLYEINPATGERTRLTTEGQVQGFAPAREGVVIAWASLGSPPELHLVPKRGARSGATQALADNNPRLAAIEMAPYEQFSFKGWNDETVYGYVLKPHGFKADQKYPVAFIVHGGPQSSFQNVWSWRWNPQIYAGAGYAVVVIDFHGSPGYGQAFTDSISGDWGGKPLEDLQKGLAQAIERYDWLDGDRACSLGASYGGYMQNWIAGQWSDRFRCIVNHAGIFDQRSMYYTTEELWFVEWENGGPYYAVPQNHERHNPAEFVANWRTPMLVIHGARDYRVPYSQGLATFTALQRRGIESRLLYFSDENHWILKPANSLQWHEEVLGWLKKYLSN
jgi:dipeptidyl aminopeptidase/acylaminoacyl peptidase